MKKILILSVLIMMVVSPLAGIAGETTSNKDASNISVKNVSNENFTHTVLAEYGTLSYCPHCPLASDALDSIYQSEDYPFYYVSLVADKNSIAASRTYYLPSRYAPAVYFDGAYLTNVGSQDAENVYMSSIEECGMRAEVHPINMSTEVTWDGASRITVTVTATNNGNLPYVGILRSYVTEIVSRWNDQSGDPYHFGFLDFAINRPILLLSGKTRTFSTTWDGTEQHGDQSFEDITEDNIFVISAVSHWRPYMIHDAEDNPYLVFYVDHTSGATPVQTNPALSESSMTLLAQGENSDGYINITVQEAWDMLNCSCDGRQIPIDVRTLEEYIGERIYTPSSKDWPRLFPWRFRTGSPGPAQLEGLLLQLFMNLYKNKDIITYCRSGSRSFHFTEILVENNFEGNIYNMMGGITSWTAAGLPTVKGLT
ncbi:MAG: rhodanese-like domain-containing protein [Candidatus Thermoplasmatota archaeon]|nr:rhodanese-like domain-containing protein [Candidatus Thermoplasmatota archaeon]